MNLRLLSYGNFIFIYLPERKSFIFGIYDYYQDVCIFMRMRISNFKNSHLVLDSTNNSIDSIWISNQGEWRNYPVKSYGTQKRSPLRVKKLFITSVFEDDILFPYVQFYVWIINIIINIYLVWWLPVTILTVLGILHYMFMDFVYL